jgi:hypothetical protein
VSFEVGDKSVFGRWAVRPWTVLLIAFAIAFARLPDAIYYGDDNRPFSITARLPPPPRADDAAASSWYDCYLVTREIDGRIALILLAEGLDRTETVAAQQLDISRNSRELFEKLELPATASHKRGL